MLDNDAPAGIKPVNVAWLISVLVSRMKSSAVSVWMPAELGTRASVAIFPSGLPVVNEKTVAEACVTRHSDVSRVEATNSAMALLIIVLPQQ